MQNATPAPPRARSLRLWMRIAIAGVMITLAMVISAGVYLQHALGRDAQRGLERRLREHLTLLSPPVRADLVSGDLDGIRAICASAKSIDAIRVTVIRPNGEVVAESERSLPLANHKDRPEIVAAMADGSAFHERYSTSLGEPYLYFARRLDGDDGRPVGVLRLAVPLTAVAATHWEAFRALMLSALVGLPVALVLAWLLARRIARPLEEMTEAATRMASGDFERLPRGDSDDESGRLADALGRMGGALSEMLSESESERLHLDAILTSMVEGVLAIDLDGRVLRVNRAAAECLGLRVPPSIGTPLEEFVRVPEVVVPLRAALEGEDVPESDVRLPGTAGHVITLSAVPMTTADGEVLGAVAVLRDVTVMRRLEQMRLDFVANVSHELRTPLAAVSSSVETVRDLGDAEPEMRSRLLETANRHCRRLSAIVDDLLALSRIESEGDRLERTPVDLLRTIRAAASTTASDARTRNVTLGLPGPGADKIMVIGHEGRLEQIWTNLLTNGVKYNREGGSVTVTVARDEPGGMAVVKVADTGQGIPAEHLPRIFERFYRVDKSRSREQGGTGLGLSIVKHIVRSHRGSLDVTSESGKGTTFEIRLPLA